MTMTKKTKRLLKSLAKGMYGDSHNDRLAERAGLGKALKTNSEGGMVAVVESGMDCDGVRYDGRVSLIRSSVMAYLKFRDDIERYADGPFYLSIMKPSSAKGVSYTSRDLGMEAFENGHPHVIYG